MTHASSKLDIQLKRAYEHQSTGDGFRVLVDRLWPRGLRKADAGVDQWFKEVAPSAKLRQWFGHDVNRWKGFRQRYRRELAKHPAELKQLRSIARQGRLTLIYSARDEEHNQAVVLRNVLLH